MWKMHKLFLGLILWKSYAVNSQVQESCTKCDITTYDGKTYIMYTNTETTMKWPENHPFVITTDMKHPSLNGTVLTGQNINSSTHTTTFTIPSNYTDKQLTYWCNEDVNMKQGNITLRDPDVYSTQTAQNTYTQTQAYMITSNTMYTDQPEKIEATRAKTKIKTTRSKNQYYFILFLLFCVLSWSTFVISVESFSGYAPVQKNSGDGAI
jgi:hypothetical protein